MDQGHSNPLNLPNVKKPSQPTFHHQDELPSLPVPSLESTFEEYLKSIEPFVTKKELEYTQNVVKNFVKSGGKGEKLQAILEERGKTYRNWLEEWWEYAAYLSWRQPIALSVNMFTGFGSHAEFTLPVPQARRSAEIIRYTCEFHELLQRQLLKPETMGGKVMCMNLFTRIFSSCRIPDDPADYFQRYESASQSHICILIKKCCFFLDVYDANRQLLTIGDLEHQIQLIQEQANYFTTLPKNANNLSNEEFESIACGIGSLTAIDRIQWAQHHNTLLNMKLSNGRNLDKIQSSLFVVVLDQSIPQSPSELIQYVSGGDSANRWFDKSLQYIVFQNGMVGANMEHGNADATVFMSMFRWLGKRYLERAGGIDTWIESRNVSRPLPPPEIARWTLTKTLEQSIQNAQDMFKQRTQKLLVNVERYKDCGRIWLKSHQIPPDSFVQVAIQLAYYTLTNQFAPTYESAHTRFYYHGRTETIRSCTKACVAFVKSIHHKNLSKMNTEDLDNVFSLFQQAIEAHMEIGMKALNGQGIDRHLLGLQVVSMLSGDEKPLEFVQDPAFGKSGGNGNYVISTSNVSGYQWLWGGFTPMVSEGGIGICYDCDMEFLGFLITSYQPSSPSNEYIFPFLSPKEFSKALFTSLHQLQELITMKSSKL